ncbi:Rieske (2Fe-2S) protein [Streptomyces sp. NRRL S-118]|uniref:Rieske (2Fe-2S) protein n=1 Tax=Streptomyces sp. NRRL S-118 TaxID=1463881 RepID=UPI0004CA40DB|nr:Rieske (2Fe-2S) protein [Streptomyces sp. NRRL S-118]
MSAAPAPRRTVLAAAAAAAAAPLVTGCGDGDGDDAATPAPTAPAQSPTGSAPAHTVGQRLASTADIPSGGGTVFKDQQVVVTQPQAGEFRAFSAICTHQRCVVAAVEDGTINCACHGSRFRITDGSVVRGPATRPLPAEDITVSGDTISLA